MTMHDGGRWWSNPALIRSRRLRPAARKRLVGLWARCLLVAPLLVILVSGCGRSRVDVAPGTPLFHDAAYPGKLEFAAIATEARSFPVLGVRRVYMEQLKPPGREWFPIVPYTDFYQVEF